MIDSLRLKCLKVGTESTDKKGIIREISLLAKESEYLKDISAGEIEEALTEREELVSTGLTGGIAIPHCSFDGIDQFVVGLIVSPKGIDFQAIDGGASKLFFFIIGPKEKRNRHIKILSSISKITKDPELIKNLLSSSSAEGLADLLKRDEEDDTPLKKLEKVQFVIHVQKEDLFYDVLEVLSSEVEGAVSVLDAATAGSYLHRLPLFSSFWNEKAGSFSKMIVSVIDKPLMNDTIRRLNMVMPENREGIIISVNDLLYFEGNLDF